MKSSSTTINFCFVPKFYLIFLRNILQLFLFQLIICRKNNENQKFPVSFFLQNSKFSLLFLNFCDGEIWCVRVVTAPTLPLSSRPSLTVILRQNGNRFSINCRIFNSSRSIFHQSGSPGGEKQNFIKNLIKKNFKIRHSQPKTYHIFAYVLWK